MEDGNETGGMVLTKSRWKMMGTWSKTVTERMERSQIWELLEGHTGEDLLGLIWCSHMDFKLGGKRENAWPGADTSTSCFLSPPFATLSLCVLDPFLFLFLFLFTLHHIRFEIAPPPSILASVTTNCPTNYKSSGHKQKLMGQRVPGAHHFSATRITSHIALQCHFFHTCVSFESYNHPCL